MLGQLDRGNPGIEDMQGPGLHGAVHHSRLQGRPLLVWRLQGTEARCLTCA